MSALPPRKIHHTVWAVAIVAGLVLFFCMGLHWVLELVWVVISGWLYYLARTLPNVQINWAGLGTGLLWIALFALGLHGFCQWLYGSLQTSEVAAGLPPRRWRGRWTAMLVGLVGFLFSAGTAAVCVAHQVGFLATSEEPMYAVRYHVIDAESLIEQRTLEVGGSRPRAADLWWEATMVGPLRKPLLDDYHVLVWDDPDQDIANVVMFHRDPALRAEHGIVVAVGDRTVVRSADQLDEVLKLVPSVATTRSD